MDKYKKLRKKMVDAQLKTRDITDPRVLSALESIPRHLFVDEGLADQAYNDNPLPIDAHQTISQPYIVALMTQALELKSTDRVLEIGTGSGYQTAILATLAFRVFSMERIAKLAAKARKILDQLNYYNVAIRVGDGSYGWKEEAPFDAIITTAAVPDIPQYLVEQLVAGGRLIAPVGNRNVQTLYKITRDIDDPRKVKKDDLGGCRFVSLIGESGWQE